MAGATYDRSAEDVGNIVQLEHINLWVPDQRRATAFYVLGLGLTRDPYLMVGLDNMWINVGRQQFHLPTNTAQVARGRVGLVLPDLDALRARLESVAPLLEGTRFGVDDHGAHVDVRCPWGNRIRCHAPSAPFGLMTLGMPYVEFPVPAGAAEPIARFYAEIIGAAVRLVEEEGTPVARVRAGVGQHLLFRETPAPIPEYPGYHVAVYLADFSAPYRKLAEHGLITRESHAYEYRFQTIVDPGSGKALYQIEHEVRSVTNPLYMRPLVNRNPAQRQATYQAGRDAYYPG